MKIITVNTWGGYAGKEKLLSFFEKHKNEVDIFCLQEIWNAKHEELQGVMTGGKPPETDKKMTDGKREIEKTLSNHVGYFRPHFMDDYGLFLLVNEKYKVIAEGEVFVFREKGYVPEGDKGNHARNIQYITLMAGDKLVTVINFHGLWNGKGKTDTEDRLSQSQKIIEFIKQQSGELVLCGDFNLNPDTQSLKMFEEIGLVNLIKENNITSTRTSFYPRDNKFADYVFVSKGLKVNSFEVLPDEVSDHSAILFDVE